MNSKNLNRLNELETASNKETKWSVLMPILFDYEEEGTLCSCCNVIYPTEKELDSHLDDVRAKGGITYET